MHDSPISRSSRTATWLRHRLHDDRGSATAEYAVVILATMARRKRTTLGIVAEWQPLALGRRRQSETSRTRLTCGT